MAITWSCWLAMVWRPAVARGGSNSLNVLPGETYDIAFVANNPGIWMDHCHNLKHAARGMVAHLMYEGFDTPYPLLDPRTTSLSACCPTSTIRAKRARR
jgi:hypothetical protein